MSPREKTHIQGGLGERRTSQAERTTQDGVGKESQERTPRGWGVPGCGQMQGVRAALFAFGRAEVRGVLSRFSVQSPTTCPCLVSSFLICEMGMIAPRSGALEAGN